MKAAVYDAPGAPQVLRYADIPPPAYGTDQVLIAVEAISIDCRDLMDRRGTFPPHGGWVPGYAAAGTVVAVGSCIENRKVGDRIAAFDTHGSHAELWAVPALRTWLIPEGVDTAEAAVLPAAFGTAHHCLFARGQLKRGETVLIQSANTEVGVAAVQLAARAGANVLAAAGGAHRCARLRQLGAYHAVDSDARDVASDVLRLTGERGVDLVLDPGGATLPSSIAALSTEGRLVFLAPPGCAGDASAANPHVDLAALRSNQALLGVLMGSLLERPALHVAVNQLFTMLANHDLRVVIDRSFPLSEAAAAHAYAESSEPFGGVVMIP